MNVSVDQAREQGGVAEVDDFGVGRARNFGADFLDEVAVDENFARRGDAAGFNVKEAGGVEDDGMCRRSGSVRLGASADGTRREN